MSEEPGTAATSDTAGSTPSAGAVRRTGGGLPLAVASLLWAVAMLWSARASIVGRRAAEMEVTSTAYALPGAISATLVAGTGLALLALALAGRRATTLAATARAGIAAGAGLLAGLLAAGSVLLAYPDGWVYAVLAGTVAAAATIGGAVAGVRAPAVVAAAAWAGLAVFALGFAMNLAAAPLLDAFGAGDSVLSRLAALDRFALVQAFAGGLLAGVVAFRYLRGRGARWPQYALAGAGPGIVLLVAEALSRTAGSRVLELAGKVSEIERTGQDLLSESRVNSALVVVFAGAVSAIILVGRTLGSRPDEATSD